MITYTAPIDDADNPGIEKAIKNAKNNIRINTFWGIPIVIVLQLLISYKVMGQINFSLPFFFISGGIYFFFIYMKDKAALDKVIEDRDGGEKGVFIFQIAEVGNDLRTRYKVYTANGEITPIPYRTLNKQEYAVGDWVRVYVLPSSQAIISASVVEGP